MVRVNDRLRRPVTGDRRPLRVALGQPGGHPCGGRLAQAVFRLGPGKPELSRSQDSRARIQ